MRPSVCCACVLDPSSFRPLPFRSPVFSLVFVASTGPSSQAAHSAPRSVMAVSDRGESLLCLAGDSSLFRCRRCQGPLCCYGDDGALRLAATVRRRLPEPRRKIKALENIFLPCIVRTWTKNSPRGTRPQKIELTNDATRFAHSGRKKRPGQKLGYCLVYPINEHNRSAQSDQTPPRSLLRALPTYRLRPGWAFSFPHIG